MLSFVVWLFFEAFKRGRDRVRGVFFERVSSKSVNTLPFIEYPPTPLIFRGTEMLYRIMKNQKPDYAAYSLKRI